jgi:FkbM family methyltransferase
MVSLAIIDTIGLVYDGDSLTKKGLGGSESAVILIAKELQKINFQVTVFNNCLSSSNDTKEGVFDGVTYCDISRLKESNNFTYDIVISSRSLSPFANEQYWNAEHRYHPSIFKRIKNNAKLKIVWMHDTFCWGDQLLEEHLIRGDIDELFTLSDFHTSYVTNCDHGNRRNFEVLKNRIFITRNGAVNYKPEIDYTKKDRNVFVYNASVTKGMIPLVEEIWPRVKARIPSAKLKIIGGFYKFKDEDGPDEQENKFWQLHRRPDNQKLDIEFTGIIKQSEIAEILSTAGFFIYPGAFPETFGISSLEALLYNTPIITTRFGALEETALEDSCYLINYAIEPNGLFPNINKHLQVEKFVDLVESAYNNPYLHQQKSYYCNIIKDIAGWDSIALQWKQHLYNKLKGWVPVEQYRKVKEINNKVHQIFGRRFSNREEWVEPKSGRELEIAVVSPFYNAEAYLEACIRSVAAQDYTNYKHILIDDASTDDSYSVAKRVIESLSPQLQEKFVLVKNRRNVGAVKNQIETIKILSSNAIVMLLDGDDWLYPSNDIFDFYNNLYLKGAEFTYGSCWSVVDNIPLIAQPYPEHIKQNRDYRNHKFSWGLPYTHLRTFTKRLVETLDDDVFKDDEGEWFRAGGDVATFYNIIEKAKPENVRAVQKVVYCYNDTNPLNDYKVNGEEQTRNANLISKQKEKYSVIVPTMWRCDLFEKSLWNFVEHPLVDEIIVINNEVSKTPEWPVLKNKKIRMFNQEKNIYVNPAWNLGVSLSKNDLLCIANDDIVFDTNLLRKLQPRLTPKVGVFGIITGEAHFNQPPSTDYSIDFIEWKRGDIIHCFGQLMFLHKKNWLPVIDGLDIYFGDDFVFHTQLMNGRKNYMIYNIEFESPMAATSRDKELVAGFYEREQPIYSAWADKNLISYEQFEEKKMKRILIGIPTAKYIEPETFKSIYDLEVPEGYEIDFQYFYGYNIDQVRNLIAHWASNYDYLFSVDSDISFSKDTLKRLLSHDKDVVSGLYIQRKPGEQIVEVYRHGRNVPYAQIAGLGLVEIDGCGFGCVLVKSEVFREVGYPQFVYKSALDHKDTFSEDNYFCMKAKEKGFRIWADTTVLCNHHGSTVFSLEKVEVKQDNVTNRLRELSNMSLMPQVHYEYLNNSIMNPSVVYDIGACVLHWTKMAKHVWKDAKYIAFEAMGASRPIFEENNIDYNIGVLSDVDGREVEFYENVMDPGGNSYYKENESLNPNASKLYNDSNKKKVITKTLDTVVKERGFPLPDLIKMDVQGAEMDILKGATETLKHCKDLILEMQVVEYNKGAPLRNEVVEFVESLGFRMVSNGPFCDNGPDGDYHFTKI